MDLPLSPEAADRQAEKRKWMERIAEDLEFFGRAKKQMVSKGLTRGRKKCFRCGGIVRLRLAGKRNHLHAACETRGCIQMME